ncbi:hypothetical protein Tco_0025339 [Tanacetum coccineum]
MVPPNNFGPDLNGKAINETQYRGMIVSLMYLTASRPGIQFSTCLCVRYQANAKESYLIVVKRIFIYLKEGIIGEIGITSFRNAIGAHYLDTYVDSPSLDVVRPWFTEKRHNGEIRVKGTVMKRCLPPRWRLLMGQIIQCLGGKTGGLDQISNKDATILYCLASRINVDFARIIWEDLIHKLKKKSRERVIPYPRFISLLMEYMAPEYANESCTINPTQIFNIHN